MDVVLARQCALRLAERAGLDRRDQTRLATAVSELARNAFVYAGGGAVEFAARLDLTPQILFVSVSDLGPGIANIDSVLSGAYRSMTGMGLGLIGAKRLMDRFEIKSEPGGTTVTIGLYFPARLARVEPRQLSEIAGILASERGFDTMSVLREQNRELVQTLEEVKRREEESRQLAEELAETNRGVIALYAELDERAEQLRKASELKTRFLSNLSHEFRTPLNSVVALSRLLLDRIDGEINPEQERQVGFIRKSAEGLLELVNDMLDLAKVEAGKTEVHPVSFSVEDLFGALRGVLRPLRSNLDVELIFDAEPDLPMLYTDEAKVAQVLRNLISNSLKFTEKGSVTVTAKGSRSLDMIEFAVIDTGIGIAADSVESVFDEFHQIETKLHRKAKGTGLGLSLSRSLAKVLGGTLTLQSELGHGSTFRLVIPSFVRAVAQSPVLGEDRRALILLIDDDDTFRYVIRKVLSADPHYDLIEACDGEEGLRLARIETPDAVILDLQMPGLDGFAVLKQLQDDARTQQAPVIVATALPIDAELRAKLPAGARLISKTLITRDTVALFLREATQGAA